MIFITVSMNFSPVFVPELTLKFQALNVSVTVDENTSKTLEYYLSFLSLMRF